MLQSLTFFFVNNICMVKNVLQKLLNKEHLNSSDISVFINGIVDNSVTDSQIGAFILGLTVKGVELDELRFLVDSIREKSSFLQFNTDVLDCSGTGADFQETFNISTTSAIVAAAAGAKVVKKVMPAVIEKIGSLDFLKALGVQACTTVQEAQKQFASTGICFAAAQHFNPVENKLFEIRKEIAQKSVFNITDALVNFGLPSFQLVGTSIPEMAENMAEILRFLNVKHAMVVNAQNPLLDEISICSETTVFEVKDGEIEKYEITPDKFGIKRAEILSLRGATAEYNANLVMDIFSGKIKDSKLDVVAMNVGAMLYLCGEARNCLEGIMKAYTTISKGLALQKVMELRKL